MPVAKKSDVIAALKATAELYGKTLSETAGTMLLNDLRKFTPDQILAALQKCRTELRTFPTVADIAARIADGRPGIEEAWAMLPRSESDSVVWTEEMAEAYGICRGLIDAGDLVAARMSFKESYQQRVALARDKGWRVKWTPSLGHDKHARETALRDAVEKGRLTQGEAQKLLPEPISAPVNSAEGMKQLGYIIRRLEAPKGNRHGNDDEAVAGGKSDEEPKDPGGAVPEDGSGGGG
jgi:hypothetical protein